MAEEGALGRLPTSMGHLSVSGSRRKAASSGKSAGSSRSSPLLEHTWMRLITMSAYTTTHDTPPAAERGMVMVCPPRQAGRWLVEVRSRQGLRPCAGWCGVDSGAGMTPHPDFQARAVARCSMNLGQQRSEGTLRQWDPRVACQTAVCVCEVWCNRRSSPLLQRRLCVWLAGG